MVAALRFLEDAGLIAAARHNDQQTQEERGKKHDLGTLLHQEVSDGARRLQSSQHAENAHHSCRTTPAKRSDCGNARQQVTHPHVTVVHLHGLFGRAEGTAQ